MAAYNISRRLIALPTHLRTLAFQQSIAAADTHHPVSSPSRTYATYNTNASGTAPSENSSSSNTTTSSVNATEVSHFNTLASSWWDPHGSSRLLHLMNPLRHQFIRKCLASDIDSVGPQKLKFLDIGCGGGIFAESAARLAITDSVVGIDPTPECIRVAKGHARQDPILLAEKGKLVYKNIAIEDLPLPNTTNAGAEDTRFDIISLFEVIEHIREPGPFLTNVLQHLKPGGWLIGSTIARTGTSWFTTKFVAEEVLRMVPRGTHEWSQYINPGEMREWARSRPELDVGVGSSGWQQMGVVYVPGLGWKVVGGSEEWGNYFFGVRKVGVEGQ
ncbi:Putative ubiquinone biosynthesis O-methyltransferase [Septoria linicola]|uniref:Ubiquinone biosynthesis O-methyltransferase, mitochondrial n=1 Tax=Septoria linicola TaxID=215465 RepID=A0A9Q9EJB5_9PEZI|nr:Putative ubiquinone biosynthesis O-methyltransferase [Septoria linicola]